MAITFGIRVVNEGSEGVRGAKAFVSYQLAHQEKYSGADGRGYFERPATMHGGARADIFVYGEKVSKQEWIQDGDTFSFTV